MKKWIVVVAVLLLLFVGCGGLDTVTPQTPLGAGFDPNQARAFFEAGAQVGQGVQTTGIVLGRPELIGLGIFITAIAGLGAKAFKRKEGAK